eukprot:4899728-Amphidinium_carterae.1
MSEHLDLNVVRGREMGNTEPDCLSQFLNKSKTTPFPIKWQKKSTIEGFCISKTLFEVSFGASVAQFTKLGSSHGLPLKAVGIEGWRNVCHSILAAFYGNSKELMSKGHRKDWKGMTHDHALPDET